jgi:hypothetical protein
LEVVVDEAYALYLNFMAVEKSKKQYEST